MSAENYAASATTKSFGFNSNSEIMTNVELKTSIINGIVQH